MANKTPSRKYPQLDRLPREWHSSALAAAEKHIDDFIRSLLSNASAVASRRHDDIVLKRHVDDAVEDIKKEYRNKQKRYKVLLFFFSILVGHFIPGFFSEFSQLVDQVGAGGSITNSNRIISYVVLSLISASVSVWLLLRDDD